MDYELAKQLKEAGLRLPPSTDRDGYTVLRNGQVEQDKYEYEEERWQLNGNHYFIPTLSELIEACGRDFDRLERIGNTNTWNVKGFFSDIETEGETPEEAVAKLWLELNKKK